MLNGRELFLKFFEHRACTDRDSTGHKNAPKSSHSVTAWNNYNSVFLTDILTFGGDASCLLPVGVCIDVHVMMGSYVLCVSLDR